MPRIIKYNKVKNLFIDTATGVAEHPKRFKKGDKIDVDGVIYIKGSTGAPPTEYKNVVYNYRMPHIQKKEVVYNIVNENGPILLASNLKSELENIGLLNKEFTLTCNVDLADTLFFGTSNSFCITNSSIYGEAIQTMVGEYIVKRGYYCRTNANTQSFPDFNLSPSNCENQMEVKAFDVDCSPNFDVANFESFCSSILESPCKIEADYLIFGYQKTQRGFCISNIWQKKIWEITGASANFPIKSQIKKNVVYNIRPSLFNAKRAVIEFPPFNEKYKFIDAIQEAIDKYSQTASKWSDWKKTFLENYKATTGKDF